MSIVPIQAIDLTVCAQKGLRLFVKREDLVHPLLSGNKWYKLKYNLLEAKARNKDTLLTFGGAYSNHIYATSAAAHIHGMKSIGIIRGEEHLPLNPTLQQAQRFGMQLHYLDRSRYRNKESPELMKELTDSHGDFYPIPEGGTNALAIKGTREIVKGHEEDFDYWCLPVGTGGTIAGIVNGLNGRGQVIGFSALKGDFLHGEVQELLNRHGGGELSNWSIGHDYHFGGYAKVKPPLVKFMDDFKEETGIPLEPIYTGKMMYGVLDLIAQGHFRRGSRILAIHTGGLQGLDGFRERGLIA